jgi:CRISPR type IV-associated DEAD/DEAH-box helicase Csf4
MPVSIKIPKTLVSALYPNGALEMQGDAELTHIKKVAKQLIERAISEGLSPSTVILESEHDYVGHMTINILPKYNRKLIFYSKEMEQSAAFVALGFLSSAMNQDWHLSFCKVEDSALTKYTSALRYDERVEQGRFYSYIDDCVSQNKVGLVEASTGVGKTLAILASANESAGSSCTSIIATNTVNNMMVYLSDYESLLKAGVVMAPIYILLGRRNFVSVARLRQWAESDNGRVVVEDVDRWLDAGGRTPEDGDWVPSYTVESLISVCPEVIASEISLSNHTDLDDEGAISYAAQFTSAFASQSAILLVSHSLLCIDIRMRLLRHGLEGDVALSLQEMGERVDLSYRKYVDAGVESKAELLDDYLSLSRSYRESKMAAIESTCTSILPNYDNLYVDEGHLLENAMANAISGTVSLRSLLRDVQIACESGRFPKSRLKEATALVEQLVNSCAEGGAESVWLSEATYGVNSLILRLCETLSGVRTKKGNESWLDDVAELRRAVSTKNRNQVSVVEFSPVRAYPRVKVGEIDTGRYFKAMWARVRSAVIVSATLYIKRYNAYSGVYMKSLLSIDDIRLGEYPPVHAGWIKETVSCVHIPSDNSVNSASLMPVGKQFKGTIEEVLAAKEIWCQNISQRIEAAYYKSAGGVLVLMTSYEELAMLLKHLSTSIPLVYASSDNTLSEQKAEFISMTKAGKKPLWLSLGGAWVGMDVSGKDIGLEKGRVPIEDNVLTTLIIAKIPFGVNQSLTHRMRAIRKGKGGDVELMDTLMRLKQGLGRLVRLENQPKNREIYLLDARFAHPRYRGYLSPVKALFETYPHVEYLRED